MPGNPQPFAATVVMPAFLAKQFRRQQVHRVLRNEYMGGEAEASPQVATPRRFWEAVIQTARADLASMRNFYQDQKGPLIPFFMYDLSETVPIYTWDPSGDSPNGRYTVRFESAWFQSLEVGISIVNLRLIEVI